MMKHDPMPHANSSTKLVTLQNLHWTSKGIKVLGIEIHQNAEDTLEANYSEMSDKVKGILNAWLKRKLSLMGKVQLVNSVIALIFV